MENWRRFIRESALVLPGYDGRWDERLTSLGYISSTTSPSTIENIKKSLAAFNYYLEFVKAIEVTLNKSGTLKNSELHKKVKSLIDKIDHSSPDYDAIAGDAAYAGAAAEREGRTTFHMNPFDAIFQINELLFQNSPEVEMTFIESVHNLIDHAPRFFHGHRIDQGRILHIQDIKTIAWNIAQLVKEDNDTQHALDDIDPFPADGLSPSRYDGGTHAGGIS